MVSQEFRGERNNSFLCPCGVEREELFLRERQRVCSQTETRMRQRGSICCKKTSGAILFWRSVSQQLPPSLSLANSLFLIQAQVNSRISHSLTAFWGSRKDGFVTTRQSKFGHFENWQHWTHISEESIPVSFWTYTCCHAQILESSNYSALKQCIQIGQGSSCDLQHTIITKGSLECFILKKSRNFLGQHNYALLK